MKRQHMKSLLKGLVLVPVRSGYGKLHLSHIHTTQWGPNTEVFAPTIRETGPTVSSISITTDLLLDRLRFNDEV